MSIKKAHPRTKTQLHPRNKHRERYDFKLLTEASPALNQFVAPNKYGDLSIDFFDPHAVIELNKALLKQYYNIKNWNIPSGYLCPPVPGRADYIHHIADLLGRSNRNKIPTRGIQCIDIGAGANYIYPIIGIKEYKWSFVSTEIDDEEIVYIEKIMHCNPILKRHSEIRKQPNPKQIFKNIVRQEELFDLSICNPPFFNSKEEADNATIRKLKNISRQKNSNPTKNFGGQSNELWCNGGEVQFIKNMISESKEYADCIYWFSTFVSKEENLKKLTTSLKNAGATKIEIIPMGQGQKKSRILAWTFLTPKQEQVWVKSRWN